MLHHPLISDSTFSGFKLRLLQRWRFASAIRRDQLIDILHMLAQPPLSDAPGVNADTWQTALGQALEHLEQEGAGNVVLAASEIQKVFPNDLAKAGQVIAQNACVGRASLVGINQWFDSMMNQVSQRFIVHTRIWTVVFVLILDHIARAFVSNKSKRRSGR